MIRWLIIIAGIAIISTLAASVFLQPNDFKSCEPQPGIIAECAKADAIVVVSGGDTMARTSAGITLYREGWADALVLSGAAQDKTGPSNAAAMRQQAITQGVPETAIYIDEEALNTQQNAENAQTIFKDNGFTDIILVTSGYHQRRANIEFERRTDDVVVRNYPVTVDKDWGPYWFLTARGWWLAGGEMVKIVATQFGVIL